VFVSTRGFHPAPLDSSDRPSGGLADLALGPELGPL